MTFLSCTHGPQDGRADDVWEEEGREVIQLEAEKPNATANGHCWVAR